jgi:hypothetical protein
MVKTFVMSLVNPAVPRSPANVTIYGGIGSAESPVATDAVFAAKWPIVLPLLTCDEVCVCMCVCVRVCELCVCVCVTRVCVGVNMLLWMRVLRLRG